MSASALGGGPRPPSEGLPRTGLRRRSRRANSVHHFARGFSDTPLEGGAPPHPALSRSGARSGRGTLSPEGGGQGDAGLAARLLLARGHDEHAVDLVARRRVLDAIADPPDAVEPPLEEIRGVLVNELLDPRVDLGRFLLIDSGSQLDREVVDRLLE